MNNTEADDLFSTVRLKEDEYKFRVSEYINVI